MSPADFADDVLDALVVPSFSRIGPALRRRAFRWAPVDLAGRRIAVTGPTSGLGLAAVRQMAQAGAELVLLARNRAKAEAVAWDLVAAGAAGASVVDLDLASLASAGRAGDELAALDRLDALVHNGGGLHGTRQLSDDGIELTFATHVVAPFVLTAAALPALERSPAGRVVTVTSGGMYTQALQLDDLQSEHDYRGPVAYARAKRAQVDLTALWANRLASRGVLVHAMHPGWADTPGLAESLPRFRQVIRPLLRTPDEGADTITWLCGAPPAEIGTGRLWLDRRPRPTAYRPRTRTSPADTRRLWQAVVELSGRPDPLAPSS